MSAGDGLFSLTECFADTAIYCAHCRQDLHEPKQAFRCSRCKVVQHCSRDCQKSNFSLHKSCCKRINGIQQQLDGNGVTSAERMAHWYDLAYTIMTLGYKSTDTIERGKHMYECALLEYHKIMRQDPFYIGACESMVLLLAILGHDGLCLTLIHFMLHPPPLGLIAQGQDDLSLDGADLSSRSEASIRHYTRAKAELDEDVWIYGPPGRELEFSEYDMVRDMIPKYWGANVFLVPLMLVKMRQSAEATLLGTPPSWEFRMETVEICRQVEYSADFLLPVLRSLFPDSQERWGTEEVCCLLAGVDYRKLDPEWNSDWDEYDDKPYERNSWENSCPTFWMMLKDCYSFTPGILDVLEITIKRMTELGITVIREDPDVPTCAEFTDFISHMAERQRNGTL